MEKNNIVLIKKEGAKVTDIIFNYAVKCINPDIKKEQINSKLEIFTSDKGYIAVGIGSSDKKKMTFPEKLAEFLEVILKDNPELKFHILGYGKNDIQYFERMKNNFSKSENLICYINKLNLVETMQQIAHAKLYIGFDSGLYNIAYMLGKKQICMVSINRGKHFFHEDKNIRFIYKELDPTSMEVVDSLGYSEEISSISKDSFKKGFDSLIKFGEVNKCL